MKKFVYCCFMAILFLGCTHQTEDPRIVKKIDRDWSFKLGDLPEAVHSAFDDSDWRKLDLPHDWSTEYALDTAYPSDKHGGFVKTGIGYYRKNLDLPADYTGKNIYVKFDGIYRNSDVWVNGHHVGHRNNGYITHYYDITEETQPGGNNTLVVKVDNSRQPSDRWYSGSGIYRHVWLIVTDPVHIPIWGTYVTTPDITTERAAVQIETEIRNDTEDERNVSLNTKIYDPDDQLVAENDASLNISASQKLTHKEEMEIQNPSLWDIDNPALYTAVSTVLLNGAAVDQYHTPFGIRTTEFSSDKGFLLNGRQVTLKGVNLHHDAGCLGAAVPAQVWEYRLDQLKALGVNAVRLSHNPHMEELITLCDKKGLLVYDELYDKWAVPWFRSKKSIDSQVIEQHKKSFHEHYMKNLADFIDRDKNHPSIMIWSVGNETVEQRSFVEEGRKILQNMVQYIHEHEPTREVTCGMHPGKEGVDELPSSYWQDIDVLSYNYRTHLFPEWKEKSPELKLIASETRQYNNTRSWGWDSLNYKNNSWWFVDKHDYIAGQYIWAGFDYLGESPLWPYKGTKVGIFYTNGLPKPHARFTQSIYSEDPMVHLAVHDDSLARHLEESTEETWHTFWWPPAVTSHWNYEDKSGKPVRVYTYTNCESVELLLNGQSLGEKQKKNFHDGVIRWNLSYETGKIEAIAKNNGKEVTRHQMETAGKPAKLKLLPTKQQLTTGTDDAIVVEVNVCDEAGNVCPYASNLVTFQIDGPGKILGVDNGDMADHYDWHDNKVQVMHGKAVAVIQSTGKTGKINLKAQSGSLTREVVFDVSADD